MRGGLRVVGGRFRGRRLATSAGIRPTSERAREALFDILGSWIEGKRVLELFAGSGAVAIEALSRGAASACAVDEDTAALEGNAERLAAPVEIVRSDAARAVRAFEEASRRFDLVFLDPPYGWRAGPPGREVAALLAPGGRLVWQTDAGEEPGAIPALVPVRVARYGRNVFHFYEAAA